MTQRRIRDDRLFGALCHAGIFLGLWGLATTAAVWALRKDWSRAVRFQGAQALVYQSLVQSVLFAGAALCALWARFGQLEAQAADRLVETLLRWLSSGFLVGLLGQASLSLVTVLAILQAFFTLLALLLLVLCLFGFEPSYPLAGFLARRLLGFRTAEQVTVEKKAVEEKVETKSPVTDAAP